MEQTWRVSSKPAEDFPHGGERELALALANGADACFGRAGYLLVEVGKKINENECFHERVINSYSPTLRPLFHSHDASYSSLACPGVVNNPASPS
jgi:hypothetical protein